MHVQRANHMKMWGFTNQVRPPGFNGLTMCSLPCLRASVAWKCAPSQLSSASLGLGEARYSLHLHYGVFDPKAPVLLPLQPLRPPGIPTTRA